MLIVHTCAEAEGLEAWVRVVERVAVFVVIDPLDDGAGGGVYHQAGAAEVIGDDSVIFAAFYYIYRSAVLIAMDEPGHDGCHGAL